METLKHTKGPIRIKKCECGQCKSYFISTTGSDGRLSYADALLYSKSPKMLEQLIEEYKCAKDIANAFRFSSSESVWAKRAKRLKRLIESATEKKIEEIL